MNQVQRRDLLRLATAGGLAALTSLADSTAATQDSEGKRISLEARGKSGQPYLVLACDGGGIRGLLTALIVRRLQHEFEFLGRVNLFAGTSTGGIIALALAHGAPVDETVGLFRSSGETIFRPYEVPPSDFRPIRAIQRGLNQLANFSDSAERLQKSTKDFFHVKYDNTGLRQVLGEHFPPGLLLSDLRSPVLVTTLRLDTDDDQGWTPMALHSLPTPTPVPETGVLEAALCTSAAPLFFPPYHHEKLGYCVDGALFANSPGGMTLATLAQAGIPLDSVRLLSIGTGAVPNRMLIPHIPFLKPGDFGIGAWLSPVARAAGTVPAYPLLTAIFDSTSAADTHLCRQLLGPDRYHRVQIHSRTPVAIDDYEQIDKLEGWADNFFTSEKWEITKNWVKQHFMSTP